MDEVFRLGDVLLLRFPLLVLALYALRPLQGVVAVVAPIRFQPAKGHVPDAGGDLVQEVAVVGHHHQAAGPLQQRPLQPFQGLQIEVVGGFVQQQQVRLLQQELR